MIFRSAPSQSDVDFLKKSVPGIQDLHPETNLDRLNPQQIARLKVLRTLVGKFSTHKVAEGKFQFTLDLLKQLHSFVETEKNLVQRVAYKNVLKKIRDDLMNLNLLQKDVEELTQSNSSEPVLERAHDALEELGKSIKTEVDGMMSRLQNGILEQTSLATSSLYRASLTSERNMYAKLDQQGSRMLRRWNDVRLEVLNLLGTVNHDAQAKRNLTRMSDDLDEILRYLDEYALLPWLAPRDIVAALSTLDRRLENYQDEYNLAQPDADRIANVIADRETRDDSRQKIAERVQNFLNALGVSKNISVGGAVRLVRGTGRAISRTGMFLTRTLPNIARSVVTSVSTTPKRISQTFKQVARMIGGSSRALFGLKKKKGGSLNVKFEDFRKGRETLGLNSTIERGYDRGGASTSIPSASTGGFVPHANTNDDFQVPFDPSPRSSARQKTVDGAKDDSMPPDIADIWRDAVGTTSRTPGTTQTSGGEPSGLRSFVEEQFNRVNLRLESLTDEVRSLGSLSARSSGGELDSLRKDQEMDLLKAIRVSLERIAGKVGSASPSEGSSFLSRVLEKATMVKGMFGNLLQVLGGWKLVSGAVSVLKGIAVGALRVAGPLLKLGSFVGRILAGPVGMLIGAGIAGWNIGTWLHERFGEQIGDFIDGTVEKISGAINFVLDMWKKGKDLVGKAVGAVQAPFKASAQRDIDNEMSSKGAIHKVTRDRAVALGMDTSQYPVYDPKTRAITPPKAPSAPSTATVPSSTTTSISSSSTTSASPPVSRSSAPTSVSTGSASVPMSSVSVTPRSTSTSSVTSPSTGGSSYGLPDASGGKGSYAVAAGSNLDKMQPGVMSNFNSMVAEYQSLGGKQRVSINRGFATHEQQAALFQKYGPGRAARPGNSAHNYGIALDIDRGAANEMERMGLLAKYGFERPLGHEPWHLQVAGVSAAMAKNGIYSADTPSAQGGGADQVAQAGVPSTTSSAPPLSTSSTSKAGTGDVRTSMETSSGLPPEQAAYDPRPPITNPATQGSGQAVSGLSRNSATPSGHGTSRIPEFSYADPTFFALNLGALTA